MSKYNVMRWNCNKGGPGANCFNKKCRPKIEVFCDCFPRGISFGDVDGIVEINACGLMLEWKSNTEKLKYGQVTMYKNLSLLGILSIIHVVGNAETMKVTHMGTIFHGVQSSLFPATLDDVKDKIRQWVKLAEERKLYVPITW